MNQDQFKDPVFHMCLAGTVPTSWSLTQEVAGLNPFTVMTNIFVALNSANSGKAFRENSNKFRTLQFNCKNRKEDLCVQTI